MKIEIYTRPACPLCDEAKGILRKAARRHRFELVEKNVETDPKWESQFGREIPVVFIDGRKAFKHRIAPAELERYFQRPNRGRDELT